MKVFNLAEELEKERKKNKELEERVQTVIKHLKKSNETEINYIGIKYMIKILKGDDKSGKS